MRESPSVRAHSVGTFVQIGETAINMARVVWINFNPLGAESIHLYFSRQRGNVPIILRDEERVAFLDWWEAQAEQSSVEWYHLTFAGDEPSESWVSSDSP